MNSVFVFLEMFVVVMITVCVMTMWVLLVLWFKFNQEWKRKERLIESEIEKFESESEK